MGVGHLAAGLMLKRAEPRLSLGLLFFAALLPDFLLGVFYWAGLERAFVPQDYPSLHYLRFDFPYSHGLAASLLWSAAALLLAKYLWRTGGGTWAGAALGLAVFSHFILDLVVHAPEMPVLGRDSAKLGLGLWNYMGAALTVEMILVLIGLGLYWGAPGVKGRGRLGVLILMAVFSALTVAGMTVSPAPDLNVAGASWVAAPLILSGIGLWLDRGGGRGRETSGDRRA